MKTTIKHRLKTRSPRENPLVEMKKILKADENELAYLLNTNPRTVYRWLADESPEHYEPLQRWQQLISLAKATLKEEAIGEWFHEPNRALQGSIPVRLAADPRGFQLVHNLLGNAAYGNPL